MSVPHCEEIAEFDVDLDDLSDPLRDPGFIALLASTCDVPPSSSPAEAPVDAHAA